MMAESNLFAAHAQALGEDHARKGDDGAFRRAAADIDDHARRRVVHRQADADCRRHGFREEDHLARTGVQGALAHGAALDFRMPLGTATITLGGGKRMECSPCR
jgi:hypothetical protein